jgi:hypothetical protein
MSNRQGRLTRDVLDAIAAADLDDTQGLPDERLRALIFGRQPLTPPERRLLARSAVTRDRLAWLRHLERARSLAAWQEQALVPRPLQLLAAADEAPVVAPVHLRGDHYGVDLTPVDLDGHVWHIALRISPELIAATPGGFQLSDSEGLVWLAGHPDAGGELTGYWNRDESLWQRLQRVRLELSPR